MKGEKLIAIETKRYSELFRRLLQEYSVDSKIVIDGKTFEAAQFSELAINWCKNAEIKGTRDFKLYRGKTILFGFHDKPDQLWAHESELRFVEQMATEKIVRFRIEHLK